MIEYRTERVDPNNEDFVVQTLSTFGWVPVSSQEVYNESTEVVGVDVKAYGSFMQGFTGKDGRIDVKQRRNVTHYIVLKFARDTEMSGYNELRQLNEEFESLLGVSEPRKPSLRTGITVAGIIIIIVSVIMAIAQGTAAELWEILVCVLFPLVMIPLTVWGWVSYKRRNRNYNEVQARLSYLYDEAREITG